MYGCAGGGFGDEDLRSIDEHYHTYPRIGEIISMCIDLGIEKDDFRTIYEADAWAYYHELKALVAQQQRKTA